MDMKLVENHPTKLQESFCKFIWTKTESTKLLKIKKEEDEVNRHASWIVRLVVFDFNISR